MAMAIRAGRGAIVVQNIVDIFPKPAKGMRLARPLAGDLRCQISCRHGEKCVTCRFMSVASAISNCSGKH